MTFYIGDNYIVECIDLITNVYYRWHLNFVPLKKAYLIKDENIEVGTVFRNRYFILKVTETNYKTDFKDQNDENNDFWNTCPICGSYLGNSICQSCRAFDWDSYND